MKGKHLFNLQNGYNPGWNASAYSSFLCNKYQYPGIPQYVEPVYGEKEIYPDSCNELIIDLQETIPPERKLRIVFRAYNEESLSGMKFLHGRDYTNLGF